MDPERDHLSVHMCIWSSRSLEMIVSIAGDEAAGDGQFGKRGCERVAVQSSTPKSQSAAVTHKERV